MLISQRRRKKESGRMGAQGGKEKEGEREERKKMESEKKSLKIELDRLKNE